MMFDDTTTEFICCFFWLQCVKRYRRARLIFQHLLSDANTPRDRGVLKGCILSPPTTPPTHTHTLTQIHTVVVLIIN